MIIRSKSINLAAILGLMVSLFIANPLPASASDSAGGHLNGSVENLSLGVAVDLDYTCLTDADGIYFETQGWLNDPTLPAGLSYDSVTHHIAGTPNELGQFNLPNMVCDVFDSATRHILSTIWLGVGSISVTDPFVQPPGVVPPPAEIRLDALNNEYCQFAMSLYFPEGSDEGSIVARFESGQSYVVVHGKDLNAFSHWLLDPSDVSYLATDYPEDWTYSGERGGANPSCGDNMTVTVDYTLEGGQAASAVARVKPTRSPSFISGSLSPDDGVCSIEINYNLSMTPFDFGAYESPAYIALHSSSGAEFFFVLEESSLGDEGTIRVNLTDKLISYAMLNGIRAQESKLFAQSTGTFNCADAIELEIAAASSPGDVPFPMESWSVDGLLPCGKGTFGADSMGFQNYEPCQQAPLGSYVDEVGSISAKQCPIGMTTAGVGAASARDCFYPAPACGKGTYSPSGHDLADAPCMDAPIGSYVSIKGAMQASECPVGTTTEQPGAASPYDCFKPMTPTIAKLKTPKIAKFGSSLLLSGKSDQGTNLNITATGACTLVLVPAGVSQNFKVTMAKKAGTCKLSIFAKPFGRYNSLSKVLSIKVTKTGK